MIDVKIMIEEDDISSLLESLQEEDLHVRIFTIDAIVDNHNKKLAVPQIMKLLREDVKEVRIKAAWALGKIGEKTAISALIEALNDQEWEVRRNSVRSLGELMAFDEITSIVKMLEDLNWEVRAETVVVLEYLGWVPTNERERVLVLIGKEKWEDLSQVENLDGDLLIYFLKDSDSEIKAKLTWILGELKTNKAIVPLYKLLMQDKFQQVKENAAIALAKIGGEKVLHLLQEALQSEDWFIRKCATSALGYLEHSVAFELLNQLAEDGNRFVSESAKEALKRIKNQEKNKS